MNRGNEGALIGGASLPAIAHTRSDCGSTVNRATQPLFNKQGYEEFYRVAPKDYLDYRDEY